MGRLSERFAELRARGERALIPFLTAGDPNLASTEALVHELARAGADAIELGVPFSDPMAEGPTIQRASERALRSGTSLLRVLELVKRLRAQLPIPLVLMGYANVFLARTEEGFAEAAAAAGVDGVIIVDLPPEEGAGLHAALIRRGVDPILLAAPTTTPERLERLARQSRGFLYFVSLTGVTGARAQVAQDIEGQVRRARGFGIPVAVGFGVSTPEHAERVGRFADGVVVGSALIDRLEQAKSLEQACELAGSFVASLKEPLRRPLR